MYTYTHVRIHIHVHTYVHTVLCLTAQLICFSPTEAPLHHAGLTNNQEDALPIPIYIHIHIHLHVYTVSPHKVDICFTTQLVKSYDTGEDQQSRRCLIDHHYTYTYTQTYAYIYSVSPHRVNICFATQMAQFYHTRETNNLDGDLSITILYTHMYTHTHTYILFVLQIAPHHTDI